VSEPTIAYYKWPVVGGWHWRAANITVLFRVEWSTLVIGIGAEFFRFGVIVYVGPFAFGIGTVTDSPAPPGEKQP
jgi:hypothetical protein